MGVNSDDDDGSGDAWNRNPKAGGLGDFDKPNYLLVIPNRGVRSRGGRGCSSRIKDKKRPAGDCGPFACYG